MTDVTIFQMFWYFLFIEAFFVEYSFFTWVLERLKQKDIKMRPILTAGTYVSWSAAMLLTFGIAFGFIVIPAVAVFMP